MSVRIDGNHPGFDSRFVNRLQERWQLDYSAGGKPSRSQTRIRRFIQMILREVDPDRHGLSNAQRSSCRCYSQIDVTDRKRGDRHFERARLGDLLYYSQCNRLSFLNKSKHTSETPLPRL